MAIPIRQNMRMAAYLAKQRLTKREKFPLIVELEPLFACNLACVGCGKIQHPTEILRKRVSVEEAVAAMEECGAPMVSIAGGEPLLHPQIAEMVDALVARKRFVYLCTNAILMPRKIDKFKPSPYFSWVVHVDGLRERHDASVDREGVFDEAVAAIRDAKARGFRVTTNSTFFTNDSPKTIREVLDFLNDDLKVDAMMISPAYAYEKAPDQEHFLPVDQTRAMFREAFGEGRRKRWRLNHTPLFLDFLEGKVDFSCTAWGIPSYSVFGWQRPCYLMADGYAATYKELLETTDWDSYGRGRDPRCDNCMAHCGYEPTAVLATTKSLRQSLRRGRRDPLMHGGEHGLPPTAPLLDTIDNPADLRSLTPDQLVTLAAEIRSFLVAAVANTGGHLGSNLGAVELTLAVHRVFESPRDAILWDTGHQAYVHKLVTGRRDLFTGLRQEGGLSGYPSRAESSHDWLENSHASTALSWAHGLAAAFARQPVRRRVVAVVGDGALTGGMAYEALNNLGRDGSPVVVVLNDNGRSYAPTASRLCPNLAAGAPFFDALGLTYVGPVDGHDIAALDAALRRAAALSRPTVVHVRTTKGLGYGPAETDDEKCLHDVSPFDPVVGPVTAGGARRYTDVFADALMHAGQRDPRVVAVTAAMPGSTGLLPFARAFPDRMFDVGIAEQHAVTAAAGMATGGLRPVVAVYSTFLSRAFDQINLDVGLHRQPVVFCVDRAGITGPDGPSHHGIWDLALLTKVPGMTVLAPSSAEELEVMFSDAMQMDGGPVALRWPNASAPRARPGEVGSGLTARCARRGVDVCLLAVGRMVAEAEEAADRLEGIGISATVWDVRVAKPLDPAMITDAGRHPLVVTVEDGVREGGVGAAIADAVRSEVGRGPEVVVLGVPVDYVPAGKAERILARLGLDAEGLVIAASSRLSPVTLMARPSAVGR